MVRSLYNVSLVGFAACLIAMEWCVHKTLSIHRFSSNLLTNLRLFIACITVSLLVLLLMLRSLDEDSVVSYEAKAIFLDNIVRFFGMFPDDVEILLLKGDLEDLIDTNNTDMRGENTFPVWNCFHLLSDNLCIHLMIYVLDFARDIRASYDANEHGRELL